MDFDVEVVVVVVIVVEADFWGGLEEGMEFVEGVEEGVEGEEREKKRLWVGSSWGWWEWRVCRWEGERRG